jgi:multidrug efflux system membrane fusion protein
VAQLIDSRSDQNNGSDHRSGRVVAIVSVAAAVLLGVLVLYRLDRRPRSQDAFIYADSTGIVPEVSGRITGVHVRDNQRVAKGELLVEIERPPYELRLAEARAQAEALRAEIDVSSRQVASQSTAAKAAATQVGSARSQLGLAKSTTARLSPLVGKGYTTPQQYDQARSDESVAQSGLTTAIQKAREAKQSIGSVDSLLAQLRSAEAAESLAQWDLDHTVVRAPFDGWVSGFEITEGSYATAGHALFTLIKADEWYAIGNFRETELPSIRVGDAATVWLLGAQNRAVHGHVESLGRGVVTQNAGAPGLPKVGRTLSWVVIAQRFPVRVRLEDAPEGLARLGETANILVAGRGGR